jgi:predicted transcriptional regulator
MADTHQDPLARAAALLGPLEGRVMAMAWSGELPRPFAVRDVNARLPELAYTTLMTTLARLARKGLLTARQIAGQRAFAYEPAGPPEEYLARAGREETERLVALYGEAALAAFAAQLDGLSPDQRRRLRELGGR